MSSEDVNPDFVRQSNEFYEVIMCCVLIMLLCKKRHKNDLTHHCCKLDQQHVKIYWHC